MPVYLFTYHAYRSWMPSHPRGFTKEGEGYQPSNVKLDQAYRSAANHPPFEFDHETQKFLIVESLDICKRRGWTFHAAATEASHLHELVSWAEHESFESVRGKIRNILSLQLSKRAGIFGRPWFVTGSSRKHVQRQEHLDYLRNTYLPSHSGWRFCEERGLTPPRGVTPPFRVELSERHDDFPDLDLDLL